MNNINVISNFLLENDKKHLIISKVNDEVNIFYQILIKKLCVQNSIQCSSHKNSDIVDKGPSLFNEVIASIFEVSSKKELDSIKGSDKNFIFLNYSIFKSNKMKFININSYDYKKDIIDYISLNDEANKLDKESLKDFILFAHRHPASFFSELDKAMININDQLISDEEKNDNSFVELRKHVYKLINPFFYKDLKKIYSLLKKEAEVKKFNF